MNEYMQFAEVGKVNPERADDGSSGRYHTSHMVKKRAAN